MAYITADDVRAIRLELKNTFPKWQFSVRRGSSGSSVSVDILKGTCRFGGKTREQVNEYWITRHYQDLDDAEALEKITEIMYNAPGRAGGRVYFDKSDPQSDYFHTAFYISLSIGRYDRDYQCVNG